MPYLHLPRFKRKTSAFPLHLTERDHHIIRLVHAHRFLRSTHIISLLECSAQSVLRRLQLLYHHGYLERPRAQIDYFQKGGSRPIVYGLGSKGTQCLKEETGGILPTIRWGFKNRSVGRIFLEHALLVSDVMVALELACRRQGNVRLLTEPEIASGPYAWKVTLPNQTKLGVIPDRVFALEYDTLPGVQERAYFFLEADRGTMPVVRKNLTQTSFYRKLLAYEATWSQSLHQLKFGFHRFRVLTITHSAARAQSLIKACAGLPRGHGLFLFADQSILEAPMDLCTDLWQTGHSAQRDSLLPSKVANDRKKE